MKGWVRVEVVFAEPRGAVSRSYILEAGATLADVRRLAADDPCFAGLDAATAPAGVFGVRVPSEMRLGEGDRVEFYRPLPNDPKLARRARALKARRKS